jgi:hypothetical protein
MVTVFGDMMLILGAMLAIGLTATALMGLLLLIARLLSKTQSTADPPQLTLWRNLQQMVAIQLYADEYDGVFPGPTLVQIPIGYPTERGETI